MLQPIKNIIATNIHSKINTTGSEPLYIFDENVEKYYVKNNGNLTPAAYLINEVLCYYFLKEWNINTPEIALVKIEEATFNKDWGQRHKINYYDRLAFGSKEFDAAFDWNDMFSINGKVDFKKLKNPLMFPRISLFDMWVENEDRPPSIKNIMIYKNEDLYDFLAIDHAFSLRSGAFDTLSFNDFSFIEDTYLIQSLYFKQLLPFLKENPNWEKDEMNNFYLCTQNCIQIFSEITKFLPSNWGYTEEIKSLIENFLFNEIRNKKVLDEYISHWK